MGKIGALDLLKSLARRGRVSAVILLRLRGDNTFSPRRCSVFSAVTWKVLFIDRRKSLVGISLVYLSKNLMKPTNDTSIHGVPFHEQEDTDATVFAHEVSPPID